MSDLFSQNLLLAIVRGLRCICKKNIKSENFTLVSGFLSCDIDGKTQHRFVINELISRENSGEGHSSCLKVIDWKYLSGKVTSQRNEKSLKQSNINQPPATHNHQDRHFQGPPKNRCMQTTARMIHDTTKKCLNQPSNRCQFTGSQNKRSNQTFTLEDLPLSQWGEIPEHNLTRNFSSATISISSKQISSEYETLPKTGNVQNSPNLASSSKILSSASPLIRSLCKDYRNAISVSRGSNALCVNDHLSDQLSQGCKCSEARINSNAVITEVKRMNRNKNLYTTGNRNTQKSYRTWKDSFKFQNTANSSNKNVKHIFKRNRSSSWESDTGIDSIRPRYLVKHNDELLLPCPNLSSKYNRHLATTKNNNRTHIIHLPSQSCEENVPNTSHFSVLLSSFIDAFSYSSSTHIHDACNDTYDVSQSLGVEKLEGSNEILESSNDSLTSVSSLETDSPGSFLNTATEMPNWRLRNTTKKMSHIRHADSNTTGESSAVVQQRVCC